MDKKTPNLDNKPTTQIITAEGGSSIENVTQIHSIFVHHYGKEMLTEFEKLGQGEKFFTLVSIAALLINGVSLFGLFLQLVRFPQLKPFERPLAAEIGLPAFFWDTQIADALTLMMLLYSTGVLLFLLYHWNLYSIVRQKKLRQVHQAGGKKQYFEKYTQAERNTFEKLEKGDLRLAALLAALPILAVFQLLFLMWLRVFIIFGTETYMALGSLNRICK